MNIQTDKLLLKTENYYAFIDECKGIITEGIFNAREELLKTYWSLGKRIREEFIQQKWAKNNSTELIKQISQDIGKNERDIYYSIKFYDEYSFSSYEEASMKFPDGKNSSWSKMKKNYLLKLKKSNEEIIKENKLPLVTIDDTEAPEGEYTLNLIDIKPVYIKQVIVKRKKI